MSQAAILTEGKKTCSEPSLEDVCFCLLPGELGQAQTPQLPETFGR